MTTHPTAEHYIVLWALFHSGQFSTAYGVNVRAKMEFKIIVKALNKMRNRDFCDGDPWIASVRKQGAQLWYITGRRGEGDETTGGWRALLDSATNPVIVQAGEMMWRDEALSGITCCGTQSKILHAALGRR